MNIGNSFKNIERLRYRINVDNIKLKKTEEALYLNLSLSVFSGLLSAVVSWLMGKTVENSSETSSIADYLTNHRAILIVSCVCVFILCYLILFYGIKELIWQKGFFDPRYLKDDTPEDIIKRYDNIACDSILLAWEYMQAIKEMKNKSCESACDLNSCKKNLNIIRSYYYEIIHYLDKAAVLTASVISNSDNCIRTSKHLSGVELYRLYNNLEMMRTLKSFLVDEKKNIVPSEFDSLVDECLNIIFLDNCLSSLDELKRKEEQGDWDEPQQEKQESKKIFKIKWPFSKKDTETKSKEKKKEKTKPIPKQPTEQQTKNSTVQTTKQPPKEQTIKPQNKVKKPKKTQGKKKK